jgi:hypothetical protein
MNEAAEELREAGGIGAVEECNVPGVDYYVTPAEDKNEQHVRVTWLKNFRDDFHWAGTSFSQVGEEYVFLVEK